MINHSQSSNFLDLLCNLKPIYVLGWRSTCLFESLASGIIPISLIDKKDTLASDIVYPFYDKCLLINKQNVNDIFNINNQNSYDLILNKLRQ